MRSPTFSGSWTPSSRDSSPFKTGDFTNRSQGFHRKIDQRSWQQWEIWMYKPNYSWEIQSTEIFMFTEIPLADSPDARRNRDKSITNHNTSPNRSPRPLWPLGVLQEYQRSCCRSFQSRSTANERIEWCNCSICRGELRCELWLTVCLTPWTMKKSKHRFESMYKPIERPCWQRQFFNIHQHSQKCVSHHWDFVSVQSSEIAAVYVGSGKPGSPGASMDDLTVDGPGWSMNYRYPGFQMFQRQEKPTASLKAVLIDWCTGRVGK